MIKMVKTCPEKVKKIFFCTFNNGQLPFCPRGGNTTNMNKFIFLMAVPLRKMLAEECIEITVELLRLVYNLACLLGENTVLKYILNEVQNELQSMRPNCTGS